MARTGFLRLGSKETGATFQAITNQIGIPTLRDCRFFPTQARRLRQRRAIESE